MTHACSSLNLIYIVLDPNVKNAYALDKWETDVYVEDMSQLEKVVSNSLPCTERSEPHISLIHTMYHCQTSPLQLLHPHVHVSLNFCSSSHDILLALHSSNGQYGYSWMWAAVRFHHDAECTGLAPHDELKQYIESPLDDVDLENVVTWWGVSDWWIYCNILLLPVNLTFQHHSMQYPTLSKMARDYLAIEGSATPLEWAFSSGGTTGTAKHNCLKPEAFEALQLLKSAYHNEHIAADKEAQKHSLSVLSLIDSLY